MKYKYLVQVIESHVEKCSATQKARNIGKTAKIEKGLEEKTTYKDGTEIINKNKTPEKVKHKETEAERLEKRQTLLQSTKDKLSEKFRSYLEDTMVELGVEGLIYFTNDGLEVSASLRRPEYDEDGFEVDSYGIYTDDTIPVGNITDEDKAYMLDQIKDYYDGEKNYRSYTEYETEDYGYSYEGDPEAYYKVKDEYWEDCDFRYDKYGRIKYHIITRNRKRRSRI